MTSQRRNDGFTLIEVLFVIIVLGLMLTIASVKLDGMLPKFRFRAAARDIANVLKLAKSTAATKALTLYIQYDLTNQKYWILAPEVTAEGENDEGEKEDAAAKTEKNVVLFERELPQDVVILDIMTADKETFHSGIVSMECTPFGTVEQHVVHLLLQDGDHKKYYSISISPVTGFIKFAEEYVAITPVEKDETEY